MRFLVQPALAPRSRAPVRTFLAFAALALLALAAQRVLAGGLSPAAVEARYLGAAEGEGLPAAALWEEVHAGAFGYGLVLFMLGALLAVCPAVPARARAALVGAAFAATVGDLLAPFAVVAAGGGGAVRVATFVAAAITLALLLGAVAVAFGRDGEEGRA